MYYQIKFTHENVILKNFINNKFNLKNNIKKPTVYKQETINFIKPQIINSG